MIVKVFDIKWDTEDSCSDEKIDIPTEMVLDVPDNIWDDVEATGEKVIELENYIADKISDISGFCHDGFDYEIVKKKFYVPFQVKEIVWNNCVATIEASTKKEAYQQVENSTNPFFDFNAEWDGCNTVTSEVVETEIFNYVEETEVSDVKEAEKYSYQAEFEIFDLLRLEKDAIYTMIENEIPNIEEIYEMDIIPVSISGKNVTLKFVPTKYKE